MKSDEPRLKIDMVFLLLQLEVLFVTRNTDSTTVFPEKRKQQKRHRRVKNSCLWCSSFIPVMTGITMAAIIRGRSDIHAVTRLIQRVIVLMLEDSSIFSSGFLRIMVSVKRISSLSSCQHH